MKTRLALLVVLAIALFVWYQRGAPNPLRGLGAASAVVETDYKSEHAWAIREIAADISEMARYGHAGSGAPAFAEAIVPWHPDLLVEYATSQLGAPGEGKSNEKDRKS